MESLFQQEIQKIREHEWSLSYDQDSHTANMINEFGELMDLKTFNFCLEVQKNTFYVRYKTQYGKKDKEPLDEVTKKRFGIKDYQLIQNEANGKSRDVFEVFSDDHDIFTLDSYHVNDKRKFYKDGPIYLNRFEAKRF
ncbi:hypothetical protein F3157_03915 [Virgibacillus dakarensis]|uniref:Uncharacterized protein n=1 Tax=Lentibacillus populi TaxID=1827502 RepID=A0A9W5TUM9_9BACI|nr:MULTISPECIES: hypothetical protein [Bacillaceae]MBT2214929.1 hypothetical protein [Virgibacillus dakarensis]MTW84804.1 hypothetical protein [Virgibacillus dakarensis]GGB31725.1 hypothetical protein GCM10011409_06380 [Lentibacillus populi]